MHINVFVFLLRISKPDQDISPFSCSRLLLPGMGHVLVRCSHTVTGLRTMLLFLSFMYLLWNCLVFLLIKISVSMQGLRFMCRFLPRMSWVTRHLSPVLNYTLSDLSRFTLWYCFPIAKIVGFVARNRNNVLQIVFSDTCHMSHVTSHMS